MRSLCTRQWWLSALLILALGVAFAPPASAVRDTVTVVLRNSNNNGFAGGVLTLVDEVGNPLANYPADYPTETRNLKYKYRCGGSWAPETSFQTDANGQVSFTIGCANWDNKITVTLNQTSLEQDVTVNSTFQAAKVNANLKSCTGPITDVPGGSVDQGGGYWYHHGDTGPSGTVTFYTFPANIKLRMTYNHNSQTLDPTIVAGTNEVDFQTTKVTLIHGGDIKSNKGGSWWMFNKPSMDLLPGDYDFWFKTDSTWDGPLTINVTGCSLTGGVLTLVDEVGNPLANYPADYPTETRNLKYKYRCGGTWAPETSFQTDANGQVFFTIGCANWDNKITVTLNQTSLEQDVTVNSTFQAAKVNANLKSCTGPITDVPGGSVDQGGGYWYHHGDTGPSGTVTFYTFPANIKLRMSYNHNSQTVYPTIAPGTNDVDFQTTEVTFTYAGDIKSNKGGSWWMFNKPSMDLLPGDYDFWFNTDSGWNGPVTMNVTGCTFEYTPCSQTVQGGEIGRGDPYWNSELGQLCEAVTYQLWDAVDPTYECGTTVIDDCQNYTPCTNQVRGVELSRGQLYWNTGLQQLCQQVTYERLDAYTGERCYPDETVEECQPYTPCTEKVRGQELDRGDPYWNPDVQQLCQQVTYQLVDAYTGEPCGEETVEECQPYVPCTEKVRGQELDRGDPYWNPDLQQLCQQVTYQLVDAYTGEACGEETVEECEGYVPCTEKVRGQELDRGDPYWNAELQQLCQQVTYQLVDAYTGELCGEETVEECEGYVPCTEKVRGQELGRGDPYWDTELQQLCQQVTYQLVDAYTGEACGEETVEECQPYVPCTEKVRGQELGRGDPYWDTELQQLCQQVTYQLVDAYTGEPCGEETVEECEGYVPCTEKVRGQELGRGDPYWDTELQQLCQQVTYQLVDAYTGEPCGEETVEECEGYEPCAETVRGDEVSRGKPYWSDERQLVCEEVTYERLDAYTGALCGTETVEECDGYVLCTETSAWKDTYSAWAWDTARWDMCRDVTLTQYDRYDRSYVCDQLRERECMGQQLPRPNPGSCPLCLEGVLFQSDRNGNWEIYRGDGCDATRLTYNQASDTAPQWNTTRLYVVFQSNRDSNWEIYTMDGSGNNQLNLTKHAAADMAPSWSCSHIYFQSDRDGNWEIYRMNGDGSGQTRLTNNLVPDAQPAASCATGKVAYQSLRDGDWELCTMNLDGTGVQCITNTPWDEVSPTWSPSGDRIAFQTNEGGTWRIAVLDVATGAKSFITRGTGDSAESPAWYYTDCEWIYFQGLSLGDWDVYRVKPDASVSERAIYFPGARDMLDDQVILP